MLIWYDFDAAGRTPKASLDEYRISLVLYVDDVTWPNAYECTVMESTRVRKWFLTRADRGRTWRVVNGTG